MAILLQSLCIRLGMVTRGDLAYHCATQFSKPVAIMLYLLCEIAIIAMDLAEVIGTAMALKLLFNTPYVWGVIITSFDVLIILLFWKKGSKAFEFVIFLLVMATATCLFIVVGRSPVNYKEVLAGYLPSATLVTNTDALMLTIGIIGATGL